MAQSNWLLFTVFLLPLAFCKSEGDEERVSATELRDSRVAMMKSLGLRSIRGKMRGQKDFLLRRFSAPKFMMKLFKEVQNDVDDGNVFRINASDTGYTMEKRYFDEAQVDTVISFFKYVHDKSWDHIRLEINLKFKIKFNSGGDLVQGGELKLFKRLPRVDTFFHGNCTVKVYLILTDRKPLQLLDSLSLHAWSAGWQSFNVTTAVKLWAQFPHTNHGLKVVVHNASTDQESDPHEFGIVGTRGKLEKRPYLVSFVTTMRVLPQFTQELVASRDRRTIKRSARSKPKKICLLQKLFVNFRKIGLDNTIIAPKGYQMYFCDGDCLYPFDPSVNATNHALVQSLMHLSELDVPDPCCVPSTLKPISILFLDDDGNVVLKNHPNMVATSCACH